MADHHHEGEQKKKASDIGTFFLKTLIITVAITALYFIISPYQNCMRAKGGDRERNVVTCRHLVNTYLVAG